MELTQTHLRYLLTIYTLPQQPVTVSAVARTLGVSKPSVTRMLGTFMEKGLVAQERYGKAFLTDAGKDTARRYLELMNRLRELIPRMGLSLTEWELEDLACLLAVTLPDHAFWECS